MLQQALARFDQLNSADPVLENGEPRALLYGQRMSAQLQAFCPSASLALQLAVRAQHLQRWQIGREQFSADRAGYHAWRKACAEHHARRAGEILAELGADDALINRVAQLIRKERFKIDVEAQTLEDVACLVFLQHDFEPFLAKTEPEKIPAIVQKTWAKMSAEGRQAALAVLPRLPDKVQAALNAALTTA